MPQELNELREFHQFLGEKLNAPAAEVSPEEALDEWRRAHPAGALFDEDTAAIQEALDDVAGGDRGITFEEFDRDFRLRRQLPSQS